MDSPAGCSASLLLNVGRKGPPAPDAQARVLGGDRKRLKNEKHLFKFTDNQILSRSNLYIHFP